jgi:serine/threonine protein kinase
MAEQLIGDYKIIEDKGSGGMARVFLAVHHEIPSMRVILKIPNDPRLVDRFRLEADKLAQLDSNPRICHIKGFFEWHGETVIVMEYIEGPSLEEKLQSAGKLSLRESARIVGEVLDVLEFAHQRGIAHRDIKPSNIMLDNAHAQRVRIIDFGIAKAETDPALTVAGTGCGSAPYMAPEQFTPTEKTDFVLSDIYATGTVLFQLITGELPYKGDNEFIIRDAKLNDNPPKPRSINPSIPKEVENVILKSMDRNPSRRFQSANEMKKALAHVVEWTDPERQVAEKKRKSQDVSFRQTAGSGPWMKSLRWIIPAILLVAIVGYVGKNACTPEDRHEPARTEAPVPLIPSDGSTLTEPSEIKFTWASVDGDDIEYTILYDNDSTFVDPHSEGLLTDTVYIIHDDISSGIYYWRVRATSGGSNPSPFSEVYSFTVVGENIAPMGYLAISINRPSSIFIDGDPVRQNSMALDTSLVVGEYSVRVVNPGSRQKAFEKSVSIAISDTLIESFKFTDPVETYEVRVSSEPSWADLYLDGVPQSDVTTPFTFNLVGTHKVRVRWDDYYSVEREVSVSSPIKMKFYRDGDSVSVEPLR